LAAFFGFETLEVDWPKRCAAELKEIIAITAAP